MSDWIELIAAVRKIRDCESEPEAQLVLERVLVAHVGKELASLRRDFEELKKQHEIEVG